jgi:hypothetical protein
MQTLARRALARFTEASPPMRMAALGALGTASGATMGLYERATGSTVGPCTASAIGIGLGGCCVYGRALGVAGTPLWLAFGSVATGCAIADWSRGVPFN